MLWLGCAGLQPKRETLTCWPSWAGLVERAKTSPSRFPHLRASYPSPTPCGVTVCYVETARPAVIRRHVVSRVRPRREDPTNPGPGRGRVARWRWPSGGQTLRPPPCEQSGADRDSRVWVLHNSIKHGSIIGDAVHPLPRCITDSILRFRCRVIASKKQGLDDANAKLVERPETIVEDSTFRSDAGERPGPCSVLSHRNDYRRCPGAGLFCILVEEITSGPCLTFECACQIEGRVGDDETARGGSLDVAAPAQGFTFGAAQVTGRDPARPQTLQCGCPSPAAAVSADFVARRTLAQAENIW